MSACPICSAGRAGDHRDPDRSCRRCRTTCTAQPSDARRSVARPVLPCDLLGVRVFVERRVRSVTARVRRRLRQRRAVGGHGSALQRRGADARAAPFTRARLCRGHRLRQRHVSEDAVPASGPNAARSASIRRCRTMRSWRMAGSRLIKGVFSPDQLDDSPSLFVSRHVLEHMPSPAAFVRELRDGASATARVCRSSSKFPISDGCSRSSAFWDFCYEHCNYFTDDDAGHGPRQRRFHGHGDRCRVRPAVSMDRRRVRRIADQTGEQRADACRHGCRSTSAGEQARVQAIRERLRALRDNRVA